MLTMRNTAPVHTNKREDTGFVNRPSRASLLGMRVLSSSETFSRQRGASRLTVLVFGTLIAFVGYCLYETLPIFYRYYELENQAFGMARRASMVPDEEIKKRLTQEIRRYDIPADPDKIEILRGDEVMEIRLSYDDTLYFPWIDHDIELHTFQFDLRVKERFSTERQKY